MREYRIQEGKELEKIICNKCGTIILVNHGIAAEDVLSVEKRWNYFSQKDNDMHRFDLCEACYDELIETFQIPVEQE